MPRQSIAPTGSLAGCTIVLVGTHKVCPQLASDTLDNLKKSIADHGGTLGSRLSKNTTHLIADATQFAANGVKVKAAADFDLDILSYEWLVKSLTSKRKVDESAYYITREEDSDTLDVTSQLKQFSMTNKRKRGYDSGDDSSDSGDIKQPAKSKPKLGTAGEISARPRVRAAVDIFSTLTEQTTVYQDENGAIFDVTLNLTLAATNANKFYRLQLLVTHDRKKYYVYTRWGRVGERGRTAELEDNDLEPCMRVFEKKFKEKSGHKWQDRHEPSLEGKYTYIERSYESSDDTEAPPTPKRRSPNKAATRSISIDSELPVEVQNLVSFIFNMEIFTKSMEIMDYDVHKMPLGKLSERTLTRGLELLNEIASVIGNPSLAQSSYGMSTSVALEALTNRYYSTIPHAFGRRQPPVINNRTLMKNELSLIDSLTGMQISEEVMKKAKGTGSQDDVHEVDRQFAALGLEEMHVLNVKSTEYKQIHDYLIRSSGSTHTHIKYKVEAIFRIKRKGESDRFKDSRQAKSVNSERRLLWHGSRSTNFGGILSQGLRIAPQEAPASGVCCPPIKPINSNAVPTILTLSHYSRCMEKVSTALMCLLRVASIAFRHPVTTPASCSSVKLNWELRH